MGRIKTYDARGRHIIDVSRTSGVSGTGTARGWCGNVSETLTTKVSGDGMVRFWKRFRI
ncbi:hypothetical protein F2Q69_00004131 [Brassica cretica]|uniref:Uncharacterized protein n=1 Tax=Brassica cretica TaxID=69181 RepID=A0A8S9P810_BRACR|nr:hypothetical protein F2Q69_00004131 [Brassica cretica]